MAENGAELGQPRRRVALLYDERMCSHRNPWDADHPERPDRIRSIWNRLTASGIADRCVVLGAKEAEDKHLTSVHTKEHVNFIKEISSKSKYAWKKIAYKLDSIYFNEGSSEAACLSAGSVVEVSRRVAKGEFQSAVAIVRPPGHHAEPNEAMGFCLYNNVAIAARFLLEEKPELGIKKILIVDWDVHHGNGTQKMFWKEPRVLYFSVHRHDFGTFYPTGDEGDLKELGEGLGRGFNINVPWEHGQCGDADYLAVWDHVLIPVVKEYNPDFILISGGFDSALGDPLGECCVTPYGYSLMMEKLMRFANGKIVMALEGGYNLNSTAKSVSACVEVLLDGQSISGSLEADPFDATRRVIKNVRKVLSPFWRSLAELPEAIFAMKTRPFKPSSTSSSLSHDEIVEGKICDILESSLSLEADLSGVEGTRSFFSKLQIGDNSKNAAPEASSSTGLHGLINGSVSSWRADYAKREVWYGGYGSNMWKPRFLCYLNGGQVDGMHKACSGSMDKSLPKVATWKVFHHRLFFGHSSTATWGPGGVAFLDPRSDLDEKAYLCLYKITLEQFNDILLQENRLNPLVSSPLFDLSTLQLVMKEKHVQLEALKDAWYSNILFLETDEELPILTFTCSPSDVESFKSGQIPMKPPSETYKRTLMKGMIEGKFVSESDAQLYLYDASVRKL